MSSRNASLFHSVFASVKHDMSRSRTARCCAATFPARVAQRRTRLAGHLLDDLVRVVGRLSATTI
jgi:hypothetical protein